MSVLSSHVTTAAAAKEPIDRHALVTRHNIDWNEVNGQIPLGNGQFCFNADGTGLQTFGGSMLSHWAWHSVPLPAGCSAADIPATGTVERGRITGPMRKAAEKPELDRWMFRNPHPVNLGRLRLVRGDGSELGAHDVTDLARTHDLWTGLHTSHFKIDGQPVAVQTCVHPALDLIAVRIESKLLDGSKLAVMLDFPYPSIKAGPHWVGDWDRPDAHASELSLHPEANRADITRTADATTYHASLAWSSGCHFRQGSNSSPIDGRHRFILSAGQAGRLEFVCAFSAKRLETVPSVAQTQRDTAAHWRDFWTTGGAVDLSQSRDPRWMELERRIVLSQYQMAAQSAGSWPSSESGLMTIDPWSGQFHMEMVWWHLAHYALWDRWSMAEESVNCYQTFLPMARRLAGQFDYKGAKWGKQVGPEGRTAPWSGSFILHWQQPHPIFFAELDYRLHPTRAMLEKWRDIVFATADYMADFPTRDETTGLYSLVPIMPPSEQGVTRDTVFDLAYWRWGLDQAQRWRQRLGLPRDPAWDRVRRHLAPLPMLDGVFVHSAEWKDTYEKRTWEHPDPIGVLGMLSPTQGVDPATAHRTVLKVWRTWQWDRCWGWDFPWMAMAAARVGEPEIAVEALLKEAGNRNRYDRRGVNLGGPGPYLPGNGGLLYAVALMAAGWEGDADKPTPGFPDDGTWTVQWEGLKKAP